MEIGIGVLYRIVLDFIGYVLKYFTKNKRRLTQAERVELRAKWEVTFKSKLLERSREQLVHDVIIRDVLRVDDYPESETGKKKGISPWFRIGLLDTYHRGIMLGLDWVRLTRDESGSWHYPAKDKKETVTAILTGYVRYENIQHLNWDGDEYYGFPHIYCHFDEKGRMPYEKILFCERREMEPEGFEYYVELDSFENVEKLSKLKGTSRFYPPT